MKSKRAALFLALGGLICGVSAQTVSAQEMGTGYGPQRFVSEASFHQPVSPNLEIMQVGHCDCDAGQPCSCDAMPVECETSCGCGNMDCDSGECGCDECAGSCPLGDLFEGEMGEPFSLFGEAAGLSVGGWAQFGYHSKALPLFNSRPDEYQAHQVWLYAEKALDTSNGFDIGGRVDYVYGTDSQDTQAFGINNNHWDNQWDNGNDYGHALPQVYGEVGYGDLSVKFGHFFTIIGYEVVGAPDNFFYSHAYTMYNSEPFTHTGVLATWSMSDDLTAYGGYTMGWDSGFEDNGDSFLGGVSLALSENVSMTYAATGGRFSKTATGGTDERGYMHSIVTDVTLTEKLQYIGQSDLLTTEQANGATNRETYGLNNYLIYTMSDCLALGTRFEWYNAKQGVFNNDNDLYALTTGLNFKPCANVLVRPEIRWDWVDGNPNNILENNQDDQTTFGIDTIFLF